ncbi:MAG: CDP-diacylglycerol--serine O-phosphatidyltransferase [Candidatus Cloacimonadota bacterium]|nr:MAG: CDP-diacylglycerol--serine O-phosphatidyltransferase [Candidatus Cloacimonadota bacterium]
MNKRIILPNIFTGINLFFGFFAILFIMEGKLLIGAWFILLCFLMDGMDGVAARMTKGYSLFGANFDSIADIVSFGIAPAMLMFFVSKSIFRSDIIAGIVPYIFALCGALRLARFNTHLINLAVKHDFIGLPIPIAAVLMSSFFIFFRKIEINSTVLILFHFLGLVTALLMVSKITFLNFNSVMKNIYQNKVLFIISLCTVVTAMIIPHFIFFPVFFIYLNWDIILHIAAIHRNIKVENTNS